MGVDPPKSSGARRIGLVECPACRGADVACAVCSGGNRVTADDAVAWSIANGSQKSLPPPPRSEQRTRNDALLLDAIAHVVARLESVGDQDAARALGERAQRIRARVLGWQKTAPTMPEHRTTASEVLDLHVTLGKLARGE